MSEKFQHKFRIASARLINWDYASKGAYFITICTHNRNHYFGEIVRGENGENEMDLTPAGKLAENYWREIPVHFPFIELGNFVVMPNHVHGVLIHCGNRKMGTDIRFGSVETLHCNVSTEPKPNGTEPKPNGTEPKSRDIGPNPHEIIPKPRDPNASKKLQMALISPKPGSISTVIRSYKSAVTKNVRLSDPSVDFKWQSRFHDHIIRDNISFERIQKYIADNPRNWKEDRFHD